MLQIFRNRAQSIFIQAIVLIIALVFIFWGIGANLMGSREAAAVVNKQEISRQDFQRAYENTVANYRQQFGGALPDGLLEGLGIKQQVLRQLIQGELLRQGGQKMGIHISAAEIQAIIKEIAAFQDNGSFSMERYKAVLGSNRLTPRKFELSLQKDTIGSQTAKAIDAFSTLCTDAEIIELFQRDQEKISLQMVTVSPNSFIDKVTVKDQDLTAWFDKNKENYKTEPKIRLEYLAFLYDEQQLSPPPSEEQLQAAYQHDLTAYQEPEQRRARHILLKTKDKATSEQDQEVRKKIRMILDKAKSGEDFATLAKQYSEDSSKENGGDLGFFSKGQMVPAFEATVFTLREGEISDIVKTQFGYHLIKLEKIKPALTKPFALVRQEISDKLIREKVHPLTFQNANTAYEEIMKAGSLAAYSAANPKKQVEKTALFSRREVPNAWSHNPELINKIFAMKKGELSSLLETDKGYFILFAPERKEPEIPALAMVQDRVSKDYIADQSRKLARQQAETILGRLKKGEPFAKVATELGLELSDSGLLSRAGQSSDDRFPEALLAGAFLLGPKNPFPSTVGESGDNLLVYAFKEKKIPTPSDMNETDTARYRTALIEQKKQELLSAWLRQQEKQAKIYTSKNL